MRIESLYVDHFRLLRSQEIVLSEGINEIVGPNAQGKTALLEAIHLLILGASFRTHQLREMVASGASRFFVKAHVHALGVATSVALGYDGTQRTVLLDGRVQSSSSLLFGNILGVTSTLEDHEMIFGPPSVRRRYLDEQISQIDPFYLEQFGRYSRALSQRNQLLKKKDFLSLPAWEEQLARSAAYIVSQRRKTVELLAPLVTQSYHTLFPENDSQFCLRYITQAPIEDLQAWYQKQYALRRHQEAQYGTTLTGPHRDDLEFSLDCIALKSIASLGQARAAAFSLRLAEWHLLAQRTQQLPLFLCDDVESTFDSRRKTIVLQLCQNLGQVIFTCHEPQSSLSHVIDVFNGTCHTRTQKVPTVV
jgi:DNA replication and repair protein RecF